MVTTKQIIKAVNDKSFNMLKINDEVGYVFFYYTWDKAWAYAALVGVYDLNELSLSKWVEKAKKFIEGAIVAIDNDPEIGIEHKHRAITPPKKGAYHV
jgi:hypothetical protein